MKKHSKIYPLLFGIFFIIIGFINWYKNKKMELGIFIIGAIFIGISIYLFVSNYIPVSKHFDKSSKNEESLKKNKQSIEEYNNFLSQVYLCGKNINKYVCIHKTTKELYTFETKIVGYRGIYDVFSFSKKPEKIGSFTQLLHHTDTNFKTYYEDLNEKNLKEYFDFMLLPPDHDSETLKKQLLSCDEDVVRNAVFAVHNLVLKPPAQRKEFLAGAYQSLPLIKKNLLSLDMGGMFASNNRFSKRAIQIIEGNNTDNCYCRLIIDEFGANAEGLAKEGFILVAPNKKIDDYNIEGVIECPVCHKRYKITEEYTGWHIPTRIHCTEINHKDKGIEKTDAD